MTICAGLSLVVLLLVSLCSVIEPDWAGIRHLHSSHLMADSGG